MSSHDEFLVALNRNRLGLNALPYSTEEFFQLAYEAYSDVGSLIVLDTGVLGQFFELHKGARNALFDLLKRAGEQNRLRIPGWVANEYFFNAYKSAEGEHRFAFKLANQIADKIPTGSSILSQLTPSISDEDFVRMAKKLKVDVDKVRDAFGKRMEEIKALIAGVGRESDPTVIETEIADTLAEYVLPTNFGALIEKMALHADRRRENRIPPGLTDAQKSKKGAGEASGKPAPGNADGDLAIWLELLELAEEEAGADAQYARVLFLFEETKLDSLYCPRRRKPSHGVPPEKFDPDGFVKNERPEIRLADVRLVSEFEARVGHRRIALLPTSAIARGALNDPMIGSNPSVLQNLKQLIGAFSRQIHVNTPIDVGGAEVASQDNGVTPETQVIELRAELDNHVVVSADLKVDQRPADDGQTAVLLIPPDAISAEKEFIRRLQDPYPKILTELASSDWYIQNAAVKDMRNALPDDTGTLFVLGRAIYSAADGNAFSAMDYLQALLTRPPSERNFPLVAGAIVEAYFDPTGHLRKHPKDKFLARLLELIQNPVWDIVRNTLNPLFHEYAERFHWLPTSAPPRMNVVMAVEPVDVELQSWKITELTAYYEDAVPLSLIRNVSDEAGRWWSTTTTTLDELIEDIARATYVPKSRIIAEVEPREFPGDMKASVGEDQAIDLSPLVSPLPLPVQ